MNLKQYRSYLARLKANLAESPVRRVARSLPKRLRQDVERSFAGQRTPDGKPWPKLKRPRVGPMLIVTGDMFAAALKATQRVRVNKRSITVTLNEPEHALFQREGTKTIPSRDFFGMSKETVEWMAGIAGRPVLNVIVVR